MNNALTTWVCCCHQIYNTSCSNVWWWRTQTLFPTHGRGWACYSTLSFSQVFGVLCMVMGFSASKGKQLARCYAMVCQPAEEKYVPTYSVKTSGLTVSLLWCTTRVLQEMSLVNVLVKLDTFRARKTVPHPRYTSKRASKLLREQTLSWVFLPCKKKFGFHSPKTLFKVHKIN